MEEKEVEKEQQFFVYEMDEEGIFLKVVYPV
jgi:hypothetical protein